MNDAAAAGDGEQQGLQGSAMFEALFASIYEVVRYGGSPVDLVLKFATRVYPQQGWIGETMRAARAGKKNCQQTIIEMVEAVAAEADRRKEGRLADTFRGLAGEMRSALGEEDDHAPVGRQQVS